jgi:hypothetical protein
VGSRPPFDQGEIALSRTVPDAVGAEPCGPDCRHREALIHVIIGVARALGLSVVARGIGTEAQRARLARTGCDLPWGYPAGAPLSAGAFEAAHVAPRDGIARP